MGEGQPLRPELPHTECPRAPHFMPLLLLLLLLLNSPTQACISPGPSPLLTSDLHGECSALTL